jgi:hypothetical protein
MKVGGDNDEGWSEEIRILSDVPTEEVADAYLEITKKIGTGLDTRFKDAPAGEYGSVNMIKVTKEWLIKSGLQPQELPTWEWLGASSMTEIDDEPLEVDADALADLFVTLLNKHYPHFNLRLEDGVDDLNYQLWLKDRSFDTFG